MRRDSTSSALACPDRTASMSFSVTGWCEMFTTILLRVLSNVTRLEKSLDSITSNNSLKFIQSSFLRETRDLFLAIHNAHPSSHGCTHRPCPIDSKPKCASCPILLEGV